MSKKYFVGCRVDQQLFNKVNSHVEQNSVLIRKAVGQYFRENEPNHALPGYDRELINVLNSQIDDLKNDKHMLFEQVRTLEVASIPWLGRIKMKLLR